MNVLLLEPFTEMRVMLRGVVKNMGVTNLYEPRTSLEAIKYLIHDPVDFFVLSDTVKPLDAIMCLKLIRKAREEHIRTLRCLVSLNSHDESKISPLLNAGVDEILQRPFSCDDIAARFHKLIRKRPGFLETKAYVGPDRRKGDQQLNFDDRRNPDFNPGHARFDHTLAELIQKLFDWQAAKRELREAEKEMAMLEKGIILDSATKNEITIQVDELCEGFTLTKAVRAKTGMLVLPSAHTLGEKSIRKLKDLVRSDRIENEFQGIMSLVAA